MQFPVGGSTGFRGMEKLGMQRPPNVIRTMVGLRNLQVFRGDFKVPNFNLQKMMLGPCHFFGSLPSDIGVTSYRLEVSSDALAALPKLEYLPIRGLPSTHAEDVLSKQHQLASERPPPPSSLTLTGDFSDKVRPGTTLTAWSSNTGIFVVRDWQTQVHVSAPRMGSACTFEVHDASLFNLEAFGVQVVKNGEEFAIPGILSDQDDLQLISYWWGEDYLAHAMTCDDGAFLETHDFPQTVTPLSDDCGGHILLARPSALPSESARIEVVAVHIPFGYTMVIGKNAWHGDAGLKGLHLMGMTANHLIMEGTTKSWFLKQESASGKVELQKLQNFKYSAKRSAGFEASQRGTDDMQGGPGKAMAIPAHLQDLVQSACPQFSGELDGGVRLEHWDTWFDEGIRKYAPWSSQSAERVAVASPDWQSFLEPLLGLSRSPPELAPSEPNDDQVYVEHQHDLAHRFKHGALQRYQMHEKTLGPVSPEWMLQAPRAGHWRYRIGRIVGRTVGGNACFTVEGVWSDDTVDSLLSRVHSKDEENSLKLVSPSAKVLDLSDVLSDHFPMPQQADDGVSELTVTVVIEKSRRLHSLGHDFGSLRATRRVPIIQVFGVTLLSLQK